MEDTDQLSWKAQGLLAYLINMSQATNYTIDDLSQISSNGDYSTRTALKELKDLNLVKENRVRNEKGHFSKIEYQLNSSSLNKQKQNLNKVNKNYVEYDLDKIKVIKHEVGLYKLFNKSKEIIYIGKSKNLFNRVKTHLKAKDGIAYISYVITQNINKASIYEPYYIEKFKPKMNTEYKTGDKLTVNLPELDFSNLIKIRR